ncbi:MAG: sulfatase-like hydrolase/transferase [Acidobacteriota bacterium]
MSRRTLIAAVVAILVVAAGAGWWFVRRGKPRPVTDVILVTIDTLRADAVGPHTPFLRSLAARGTLFTRAHAHNVVTLPSHTNILTGLYPWQHGVRDNAGFTLEASHPTIANLLRDGGFATGAFVSAFPLDSRFGLDRGFDVYDDHYRAGAGALDFAVQERPGSETLALAAQWWRGVAGRKRFLWVHLYEPHAPYLPAPGHRNGDPYLGEVETADAMLAETLGPLLAESPGALVIVTGDHGESLGEHGEQTHGLFAYEATLAVPLIVVDPERAAGRDDRYMRHIDIVPTILERTGLPPLAESKGLSLFAPGERGYTYFESLSASLNRGWAPLVGAIQDGKKLIELPLPELYDLPRDPHEKTNRVRDDRRGVAGLRALLKSDAPAAANARKSVGGEEQAGLLSLGYISGTAAAKTVYTAADDPKNLVGIDNQLHEAIAAYQAGNLARALEEVRKIVAARPEMPIAQEMLAFFLGESAKPEEAIRVLERRVESGRANDAVRIRLGLLLSETGRAREALGLLQPFVKDADPDVLNAYGIALADSGEVAGAVGTFERILAADPDNARAHQNLGIVALRAGRVDRARASLSRALALDPRLPLALNAMGVVEESQGNSDAAIALWSRTVAADPSQFDALYNLGLIAAKIGRRDVARQALKDYLARAPEKKYAEERRNAEALLQSL